MKNAEEVKSGKYEKSKRYALRVVGSVGVWEVGLETAEPVFDVFLFVEFGLIWTG